MLLCILAVPFFLVGSLYIHQYRLKQTALQRLKNEHLVCLSFSYQQAKQIEAGSEIKVQGKMMDVQSVSRVQNQVLVYGFYDEDEDALNDKLATVMNRQSSKKDGDHSGLKVWNLFMMPCTCKTSIDLQHFTYSVSHLYISYTETFTTVCLPVATPPPLV